MSKIARDLNPVNMEERIYQLEKNGSGGCEDLKDILPEDYDPTQTYNIGDVVKHEGKIYYIGMNNVTGEFNPAMTSKYINKRIPATDIKNKKILIYDPTATYDAVNKIL